MQPRACNFALTQYFESMVLVEGYIPWVFRLEVAWQACRVSPSQHRLYQHAANALTLIGGIDAQRPQIPVLPWRSSHVNRFRVS